MPGVEELASYRTCVRRIRENWPRFLRQRQERLVQQVRHGMASEKVAENILEDLFTVVLDWSLSDLNNQVDYADLVLTRLGLKYLIVEVKRPGALAWNRRAVDAALDQALRYAHEQKVRCVGISDGVMLYAADIQHGGLKDRVFVSLQDQDPPEQLWWLSVHGIYRPVETKDAALRILPEEVEQAAALPSRPEGEALHPKYKIPVRCFAHVGDANDFGTWKLPYRLADGSVDLKRLPKAIQSIISNYRGVKVSGIPEADIPEVLVRLARAAASLGKMPSQCEATAPAYRQLAEVLEQLGRLEEAGRSLAARQSPSRLNSSSG
jgi:hypothetical protein